MKTAPPFLSNNDADSGKDAMNDTILRLLQQYLYAEMHKYPEVEIYALRKKLWHLVKDLELEQHRR